MLKITPIFLAVAAKIEMTCNSPRQGYAVMFDDAAKTFIVSAPGSDTAYAVQGVEKSKDGSTVVRGKTVKGGPDFVAYLGGEKRIEFVDSGQVFQTDLCK